MFSINTNDMQYHGCLYPGCLCKAIQTTLYIRGSEKVNVYCNKKVKEK